jgi:23S rRNA maturation mini-RNase III
MMPLALAFVGDAVYELYIRSRILSDGNLTAGTLHKMAVKYVCAHSQAYAAEMLKDKLSEEETYIFKRGRNAWSPLGAEKLQRNGISASHGVGNLDRVFAFNRAEGQGGSNYGILCGTN